MTTQSRLPLRITLLLWLVLIITAWNIVRLVSGIAWRETLEIYAPHPGVLYVALTGAIWTLVGLFTLWSFWRGERWTRSLIVTAAALYSAWIWVDRLFFQAKTQANWPFTLLLTVLLLVYTAAVVLDPRNRIYFRKETYERESKKPSST